MKCFISGLPSSMCAHCNPTARSERQDFRPRRDEMDPNPRWIGVKGGRKWVGTQGVSEPVGSTNVRCAAAAGSRRGTWEPKSIWGRTQVLRSLLEGVSK